MRASETREERKKRARVGVGGLIEIKLALPACSFGVNREMLSRWEGGEERGKKEEEEKKEWPLFRCRWSTARYQQHRANLPFKLYSGVSAFFIFLRSPSCFVFLAFPRDLAYSERKIIRARNRFLESKVDLKISRPRTNFRSLKFFPSLASSRRRERKILYSVVKRRQARFTRQNFFSRLVFARALLPYLFRIHRSKANPQDRRLRGYCSSSISLSRGWSLSISVHRSILPRFPSSCLDFSPPVSSSFFVVPSLLDNNTPCRILNRGSVYRDTREKERERRWCSEKRVSK